MNALPVELCLPNGLRVLVGNLGGLPAGFARRLELQGFTVKGVAEASDLIEAARRRDDFDLLLLFAPRVNESVLRAIEQASAASAKPIALFCEDADRSAIESAVSAGVNAYAVTGVTASRVNATINLALANHRCTSGIKEELDEVRQALRERRIIERAKGIVMSQRGLDEAAAYRLLRTRAMERGMRLVDVAAALTAADDLIG